MSEIPRKFDGEASNRVYEENQAEIEAETSKPFEKEKRIREVEQYRNMKMHEIKTQVGKTGEFFGINAAGEMEKYRQFLEASKKGENTGYINEHGNASWMAAIKALTAKVDKYQKNADTGRDVLDKREKNELKKKENALMAEIEGL